MTEAKCEKLISLCKDMNQKESATIREVASLIGKLLSACNGAEFGRLFYKEIEIEKNRALEANEGNFDRVMMISEGIRECLRWWIVNLKSAVRTIDHGDPEVLLVTDASSTGWGAVRGDVKTRGRWSEQEGLCHINVLELYAILYGLKSLCDGDEGKHIRVLSDNGTAVQYVVNMG